MEPAVTYTNDDGVEVADQFARKAVSPRPATAADLFPGAGPSARPLYADIVSRAGPSARPGALPSSGQRRGTATVETRDRVTDVVLTEPLLAKHACPRPATNEDLFSGTGPSRPTSNSKAAVPDFSGWKVAVRVAQPEPEPQRPPAVVDEHGFILKRSRKYGMVRGRYPDVEIPLPDVEAEREIPCGIKFGGSIRMIRKWSKARETGCAVDEEGPGAVIHGSYSEDGHEY